MTVSDPRLCNVKCLSPHGFHRMSYREWGDRHNPRVLICVHGLTRNGRDFDFLAQHLADRFRVICPDVAGRGLSESLAVADDYQLPVYVNDMVTLIARLDIEDVNWVGTSMGGLIGMALAALPKSPIKRLVLNDVGPIVTVSSLKRIGEYVGVAQRFENVEKAEAYLRRINAPFGRLSDDAWRRLTENVLRPVDGGSFELAYDTAIGVPYRKMLDEKDIQLWQTYDAIQCPTLVIRGAESDLLTHETAVEMKQRGPMARLVEIPGVGHAPMFQDDSQIEIVEKFLLEEL